MTTELRDLHPRTDPKGGSPKTPMPLPSRQYREIEYHGHTSNGTIWKVATSGIAGLFVGMTVAWFTATQAKGVSQKDMQEYVDRFSPYSHDKELLAKMNSDQDNKIGENAGRIERAFQRISDIEAKHKDYDHDISDMQNNMKFLGDTLEELRKVKR